MFFFCVNICTVYMYISATFNVSIDEIHSCRRSIDVGSTYDNVQSLDVVYHLH